MLIFFSGPPEGSSGPMSMDRRCARSFPENLVRLVLRITLQAPGTWRCTSTSSVRNLCWFQMGGEGEGGVLRGMAWHRSVRHQSRSDHASAPHRDRSASGRRHAGSPQGAIGRPRERRLVDASLPRANGFGSHCRNLSPMCCTSTPLSSPAQEVRCSKNIPNSLK